MTADILILRPGLREMPKVVRISELVGEPDVDRVVGKLVRLWDHASTHTPDGRLEPATATTVDAIAGLPGLAFALCQVGWLELDLCGAQILGYEQHLGLQGMHRAIRKWLSEHPKPQGLGSCSDAAFGDFYSLYPIKVGRKKALEAWRRIAPDEAQCVQIMDALRRDRRSRQWTKDQGAFVPHPATWLNQERWKDERDTGPDAGRVLPPEGKYARLCQAGPEAEALAEPAPPPPQGAAGGADRAQPEEGAA